MELVLTKLLLLFLSNYRSDSILIIVIGVVIKTSTGIIVVKLLLFVDYYFYDYYYYQTIPSRILLSKSCDYQIMISIKASRVVIHYYSYQISIPKILLLLLIRIIIIKLYSLSGFVLVLFTHLHRQICALH